MFFEYTVKVVGILESCNLRNFIDLKIRVEKQRTAYVKFDLSEDLGKGKSGSIAYQFADVGNCVMKMLRQLFQSNGTVTVLYVRKYLKYLLASGHLVFGQLVRGVCRQITEYTYKQLIFDKLRIVIVRYLLA